MEWIVRYFNELALLMNDVSFFLLAGFLLAGVLHAYFSTSVIDKYLGGKGIRSVVNAALLGVPLPLCSCGVIPAGVSLYKNGASKASAVSFLISTPQTGIDSMLVTYSMLGLPFALLRPLIAFVTGIIGGMFTNMFERSSAPVNQPSTACAAENRKENRIKLIFRYAFVDLLQDILLWLVIGLLAAALLSVIIPDDFFTDYFSNRFVTMLFVLLLSVPLYVCASSSVPLAAVLMLKGLYPGAALVLLMAGPATNIATLLVLRNTFGVRTMLIYLFTIIAGSMLFGLAIDHLLPASWFTGIVSHTHTHGGSIIPGWLLVGSSVLLTALIIKGLFTNYLSVYFIKFFDFFRKSSDVQSVTIRVEGMNCNNCRNKVERNISTIHGVTLVKANYATGLVMITGNGFSMKEIEETVTRAGYKYSGIVNGY